MANIVNFRIVTALNGWIIDTTIDSPHRDGSYRDKELTVVTDETQLAPMIAAILIAKKLEGATAEPEKHTQPVTMPLISKGLAASLDKKLEGMIKDAGL